MHSTYPHIHKLGEWSKFDHSIHRRRRAVAERLVRPLFVVEAEIPRQAGIELRYTAVVPEVDVLVLDRTPKALDEDVPSSGRQAGPLPGPGFVEDPPAAVHADPYLVRLEHAGERRAGELTALSVLKISGRPALKASSSASKQNTVSSVFESPQDNT